MIILLGLAGTGKGTQGKALSELFGWRALSVGQVIRDTGAYQAIIDQGKLIPDEDVVRLMSAEIKKCEDEGFDVILDGFPRSEYQARWLAGHLAEKVDGAIILEVPKAELYERLRLRGRDDDKNISSIDQRFEIFEREISRILPFLAEKNIPVVRVSGVGEVDEITKRLVKVVKEFSPKATFQKDDVNGEEIEKSYGE